MTGLKVQMEFILPHPTLFLPTVCAAPDRTAGSIPTAHLESALEDRTVLLFITVL